MQLKAIHKAEKTINEARNKLESELEESVKVITEVQQKLEQVTGATEHETGKESGHLSEPVESAPANTDEKVEAAEPAVTEAQDSSSQEIGDDKLFVGTLELEIIPPGDSIPLTRLQKCLSQIPGLELLLTNGSAGERTKVTVFVAKPLPLLETLKKMAPVKNAVKDKGNIQVFLETSDGWIN